MLFKLKVIHETWYFHQTLKHCSFLPWTEYTHLCAWSIIDKCYSIIGRKKQALTNDKSKEKAKVIRALPPNPTKHTHTHTSFAKQTTCRDTILIEDNDLISFRKKWIIHEPQQAHEIVSKTTQTCIKRIWVCLSVYFLYHYMLPPFFPFEI